ncbi:outer membrane receptor protein involved in Fe transport [Neolewinella xylanilytica]|uniref:Outer membrane receptor protein involved in Fe transport n=1 Tax=Neolewinella xylanilytica TaxID=1514080 RepID=A0A2S6I034_9BACT|nr:TonB-dependent receptor [Neolewinella xylanilytica]PPK84126.1 outer membrane receptor protein involved in Fe transport [Neolewinella xylanilytica]
MPYKSALLCLLLFITSGLTGQTNLGVQVIVVDSTTGAALPYVNVQVANSAQGGMTDENGEYAFRASPGTITVMVSSVGYEAYKIKAELTAPLRLDIRLVPVASTLETVTVSSNNAAERLSRPVMGVEQLNIREIELLPVALGEVDVFRGLQLVSGVNSAGEASNGLSIRGGTVDQNLVLQDGAPIFTPTHLFGLFSVFTPDAVGSVDLYRANVPAEFGGRIASVVDVRTRNPVSDHLKLQGGIGLVSSRLSLESPVTRDKRLKVLLSARAGLNDFVFKAFDRLKNTRSKFGDATLKLRYQTGKNDFLTFSAFYSRDFYELDLINRFASVIARSNQYDYSTANGSLEWLRLIGKQINVLTRLVRSDHRPRVIFPEVDVPNEVVYQSAITYTGLSSKLEFGSATGHRLTAGLQAAHYQLQPGALLPGASTNVAPTQLAREQAVETSAFFEDEWSATDQLTVSAGIRYTQYAQLGPGEERSYPEGERLSGGFNATTDYDAGSIMQTYGGFEPRLGLSYQIGPRTSLKAAYALNRQYLQNIFNSTTPLPSSRWKVSDNNLAPQRSHLYSIGAYQLLGDKFELALEGYYRDIDKLLEYKPGADFFLSPDVETDLLQGEGRTYGSELSLRKSGGKLSGEINYTYARAFNRVGGPTLSTSINQGEWYRGYFDQPHTVNTHFTIDDGRTHRVSVNLVVQSNRPYSIPNGYLPIGNLTVPIFLERNNARLPLYHRLDLSWTIHNAGMQHRRWIGDWTLTVYNLYGRKNAYNIYYQPRDSGANAEIFGSSPLASYQLTIFGAPIVSLSYSFKFE